MTFEKDYFDSVYRAYWRQNPARKLEWYRDVVEGGVGARPIRHLDIGCGQGAFVAHVSRAGWQSHGMDVSEFGIERAREAAPTADLRVGEAHEIPWSTRFDAITALDVLEHLPELDATLEAVAAHLEPDGLFVSVMPVYDGLTGPVIRRLDRDPTHIHTWARQQWLDVIGRRFTIDSWLGAFRLLPPAGPYLHFPTRRLRRHSPAILVAARQRQ